MKAIQLPKGVEVPIHLPDYCILSDCNEGQADGIASAVNTSHFPVLRRLHFDGINERMTAWR